MHRKGSAPERSLSDPQTAQAKCLTREEKPPITMTLLALTNDCSGKEPRHPCPSDTFQVQDGDSLTVWRIEGLEPSTPPPPPKSASCMHSMRAWACGRGTLSLPTSSSPRSKQLQGYWAHNLFWILPTRVTQWQPLFENSHACFKHTRTHTKHMEDLPTRLNDHLEVLPKDQRADACTLRAVHQKGPFPTLKLHKPSVSPGKKNHQSP